MRNCRVNIEPDTCTCNEEAGTGNGARRAHSNVVRMAERRLNGLATEKTNHPPTSTRITADTQSSQSLRGNFIALEPNDSSAGSLRAGQRVERKARVGIRESHRRNEKSPEACQPRLVRPWDYSNAVLMAIYGIVKNRINLRARRQRWQKISTVCKPSSAIRECS